MSYARRTDTTHPLAIDLFCGLGGWTEGLLAEGYRVVGFDIERHAYGDHKYPAQLVIQDVLTIHGSQFKTAALIVASPPCQEYSYMAMPWSRAKAIAADYRSGVRDVKHLTALFDACFRIQREANEANGSNARGECIDCCGTGNFYRFDEDGDFLPCDTCDGSGQRRYIPLVVENVRGAQPWVGRSRWNYGSFHLWGDVPALMPIVKAHVKVATMGAGWYPPGHPKHVPGLAFNGHAERAIKNTGGSWFNIGSPVQTETNQNPVHRLAAEGVKQRGSGREWFAGEGKISRVTSSRSHARKAASAMIAKIPLTLSRHIARAWHP